MSVFFDKTPAGPKICGITSKEDGIMAIEAGTALGARSMALGFNFYPPSPRSISANNLRWIAELGEEFPHVARIAVVVNPGEELLEKLCEAKAFDAIQFHGDESPEFCAKEGVSFSYWIKALRIRNEEDLNVAATFDTSFLLLDAAVPGSYGGSGQMLDWGLAAQFVADHPEWRVILAGGLTPGNVATAIAQVHPHAVDVASGVESAPGKKDLGKVRSFIASALR